jgi:hypothetical protein
LEAKKGKKKQPAPRGVLKKDKGEREKKEAVEAEEENLEVQKGRKTALRGVLKKDKGQRKKKEAEEAKENWEVQKEGKQKKQGITAQPATRGAILREIQKKQKEKKKAQPAPRGVLREIQQDEGERKKKEAKVGTENEGQTQKRGPGRPRGVKSSNTRPKKTKVLNISEAVTAAKIFLRTKPNKGYGAQEILNKIDEHQTKYPGLTSTILGRALEQELKGDEWHAKKKRGVNVYIYVK